MANLTRRNAGHNAPARAVLVGLWAMGLSAAFAFGGCTPACDTSYDSNPPMLYTGGITWNGVYATSPVNGEYLDFPGGRYYQLEHHLGFVPVEVEVWLAFDQHPTGAVSPSCTGNSCLVKRDDHFIYVKNDTCSDFWLWVTASGDLGPIRDGGEPDQQPASEAEAATDGDSGDP